MCDQYTHGRLNALANGKCPRCQSGKMFAKPAYNSSFTQMFEHCPVCNLRFEIEPGFFWGAMYVSYALSTAMMIILGLGTLIIGKNPDSWVYITIICGPIIIGLPLLYRYSRIIMIYFFSPIKFEEKYAKR